MILSSRTPLTKALSGTQKEFTTTNVFWSWAFLSEEAYPGDASTQLYIGTDTNTGALISYADNVWKEQGKVHYWPKDKDSRLTFYSYSINDQNGKTFTTAPTSLSCTYKDGIQMTGYDVVANKNIDFMVAEVMADQTKNNDEDELKTDGVKTVFRHELSNVNFTIKTTTAYSDKTFTLNSITLNDIAATGDFSQNPSTTDPLTGTWAVKSTDNITVGNTNTTFANSPVSFAAPQYLFIPQTFTNETVTIVYTILILFILIVGWFTLASLGNQMSELISSIPKIGNYLTTWIDNFFVKMSNLSLHNLDSMKLAFMNKIESYILGLQTNLPNIAMNVVTTIFSGVGQIAMSFLLAFYISYDFDKVAKSFKNLFPKKAKNEVEYLLDKLNESLYAFVSGTLWLSILLFIVSIIGFSIIGLNASVVVSFVCVITNLIPYIGPYMGAAIAGVLGFVQGPIVGILTLVFILIVQMIEGNVLHPIVMSKKMNLSPITIIISLLIFEHFFGIIGMIIATPAVAIMKIIYVFLDEKYDLFGFMDEED